MLSFVYVENVQLLDLNKARLKQITLKKNIQILVYDNIKATVVNILKFKIDLQIFIFVLKY